jgi:hypothetical protein
MKTQDDERIALLYRYTHMHELGRHIIHASEVFAVAIVTLKTMLEDYGNFFETEAALGLPDAKATRQNSLVPSTIKFNSNFLSCLELRSKAFNERLSNEINLVKACTVLFVMNSLLTQPGVQQSSCVGQ